LAVKLIQYDRLRRKPPTVCGQCRRDAHPAVTEILAIFVLKINGRVQPPTKPQAAPRALPTPQQKFEEQHQKTSACSAPTTTFLLTLMLCAQSTPATRRNQTGIVLDPLAANVNFHAQVQPNYLAMAMVNVTTEQQATEHALVIPASMVLPAVACAIAT
jgi:hypothetical protein